MADENLGRLTIGSAASIREAMEAIDRGAAEIALLVDGNGRLLGTISDGDIRRALLSGASMSDAVLPRATTAPWIVGPASGRAEVLDLMRAHSVSQIPVVSDDGVLMGLHLLHDLVGGQRLPNSAVLMAGGRGTRLGDLTSAVPKPMLPVAGRPILERLILHLVGHGVRRIRIAVNYLADVIERHFADGSEFGCEIKYLVERPNQPLGTAGALALLDPDDPARSAPILLMNGDLVTDFSVGELIASHEASDAIATMAVSRYDHRIPYGVAEIEDGCLAMLREKPVKSWLVNAGIYLLEPSLIDRVPDNREYHVTDLLSDCLARDETVNVWELSSGWDDVGRPDDLRRARGEQ